MKTKLIITIMLLFIGSQFCMARQKGFGVKQPKPAVKKVKAIVPKAKQPALPDGFFVNAAEGSLAYDDVNDSWYFVFDSNLVYDNFVLLKTGAEIELLMSSTLESLISAFEQKPDLSYRLWGTATHYGGKNYIFPIYFLPIAKKQPQETQIIQPQGETQPEPNQVKKININDPNDIVSIPEEVVEKLQKRPVVRTEQLEKKVKLEVDSILADRTGYVVKQEDGSFVFKFDAIGRNLQNVSINLLECEVLERAAKQHAMGNDPARLQVAGIVTEYDGELYLLLQRAVRIYNYGNFGK